jgi:hypothetical protein
MHKQGPSRQQGFGLLMFVLVLGIIAFTLVLGYSGTLSRQQTNTLEQSQKQYVADSMAQVSRMWKTNALALDNTSGSNTVTAQEVLRLSSVQLRYGASVALSRVLLDPMSNSAYRVFALYLPTTEDETAPFDAAAFESSGELPTCAGSTESCTRRVLGTFSSLRVQRDLAVETEARLRRIASKAQAYFKARMLQDPERNISVNYFRKPSGDCQVHEMDLGCMDTYVPLVELESFGELRATRVAQNLGLGSQELLSGWGSPIEVSNLEDSKVSASPFSMAFRARTPTGETLTIFAVQPL